MNYIIRLENIVNLFPSYEIKLLERTLSMVVVLKYRNIPLFFERLCQLTVTYVDNSFPLLCKPVLNLVQMHKLVT